MKKDKPQRMEVLQLAMGKVGHVCAVGINIRQLAAQRKFSQATETGHSTAFIERKPTFASVAKRPGITREQPARSFAELDVDEPVESLRARKFVQHGNHTPERNPHVVATESGL